MSEAGGGGGAMELGRGGGGGAACPLVVEAPTTPSALLEVRESRAFSLGDPFPNGPRPCDPS